MRQQGFILLSGVCLEVSISQLPNFLTLPKYRIERASGVDQFQADSRLELIILRLSPVIQIGRFIRLRAGKKNELGDEIGDHPNRKSSIP